MGWDDGERHDIHRTPNHQILYQKLILHYIVPIFFQSSLDWMTIYNRLDDISKGNAQRRSNYKAFTKNFLDSSRQRSIKAEDARIDVVVAEFLEASLVKTTV